MAGLVVSKRGTVEVEGLQLDVVCSSFGDRVFLLVTHLDKIGTLLDVSRDSVMTDSSHTYTVKTLLGRDEVEVHVFGRAIASSLSLPSGTPLLLGLGLTLNNHTPSMLNALLPQLQKFRTWNVRK